MRGIHRWPVNSPHIKASNTENVSIWWRHDEFRYMYRTSFVCCWIKILFRKIYKSKPVNSNQTIINKHPDHKNHYSDFIMGAVASQIPSLAIVYSTVYSGAYQRKLQRSASLAFVRGIHRWPVNSPHKGPVTRKMFPFDDVMMSLDTCIGHLCMLLYKDFIQKDINSNRWTLTKQP